MNLSLKNEGGFHGGRGSWLFTGRRGFMDIVFGIADVDGDFHPAYYDLFGKVQYEVKPGHRFSARILHAGDDLQGADEDDKSSHDDRYGSSYFWLTWDADLDERLAARTLVSGSRIFKDRHGQDFTDDGAVRTLDVRDRQETWYLGLKSDLSWEYSPRVVFKGGLDLRQGWADYDYDLWRSDWVPNLTDPTGPPFYPVMDRLDLAIEPSGFHAALYLGNRVQVSDALTTDVGLRYAHTSQIGEGRLSPRVSAAYQLSPKTTVRGAWGFYAQAQGLHELHIADGDTLFHPTQEAEHRILGLEHLFAQSVKFRVEAFQRFTSDPLPEYRNLVDRVEAVWEEGPGDRVGIFPEERRSQGIELMAKGPLGTRVAWSASYAYSKSEDRIEGTWLPRPHDQRHATHLHLAIRPTSAWTVTAAWQARTGWPASEQTYEVVTLATGDPVVGNFFGDLYRLRLPSYQRLDLRASRRFTLPRGQLYLNLDLFNALGRENPQSLDYDLYWFDPYKRTYAFGTEVDEQIPRLITLGLRWEF
jgi:outer membrane receptor protein involved in Fe transport